MTSFLNKKSFFFFSVGIDVSSHLLAFHLFLSRLLVAFFKSSFQLCFVDVLTLKLNGLTVILFTFFRTFNFFFPIQFSFNIISLNLIIMKRVRFDDGKFIDAKFYFFSMDLNSHAREKGKRERLKGFCWFYKVSIRICIMHFDVDSSFYIFWSNLLLFIIDVRGNKINVCAVLKYEGSREEICGIYL